jgi:hypothetical protein
MQVKDTIKKGLFAGIIISTPFLPTLIEKMDTAHLMYAVEFTDNLTKGYYRASPESTIPIAYNDIKKAEKEIVEEINNQFYNGRKEIDENKNIAIDVIDDDINKPAFIGLKIPEKSTKLYIYGIDTNNLKTKKTIENASVNNQLKELRNKYVLIEKSNILEKLLQNHYNKPKDITKFISIATIHNLKNPYNRLALLDKVKSSHESEIINGYRENKKLPTGYYLQDYITLNLNSLFPIKIDKGISSDSIENIIILDPSLYKNIIRITKSLNNNPCLNLYLLSKTDLPLFSYYISLRTTYKENNICPTVYNHTSWIDQNSESGKNTIKKETLNYINNTTKTDRFYNSTFEEISVFYNTDYKKLWEKCNSYEIKRLAVLYFNKLDEYDTAYLRLIIK